MWMLKLLAEHRCQQLPKSPWMAWLNLLPLSTGDRPRSLRSGLNGVDRLPLFI